MCILDEQGKKTEEKFDVTTREIKRMGLVMKSHFVSEVCMGSTGIYWISIWRLLENDFQLRLVNAQFLKQLLGRKSDVKDAEWIAKVFTERVGSRQLCPWWQHLKSSLIRKTHQRDKRGFGSLSATHRYDFAALQHSLEQLCIRRSQQKLPQSGRCTYQRWNLILWVGQAHS